jgi:ABC-type transporter Mla subunit MlaD
MKGKSWILALFCIVVLLSAGLYVAVEDNPFRGPKLRLNIRFEDAAGVHNQSKVTFLGIPVGSVNSIEYAPNGTTNIVLVHVFITRDIQIPASVEAYLEPTLLGDSTVALKLSDKEKTRTTFDSLKNDAEITGKGLTKIDAVLPGFDAAVAQVKDLGGQIIDTLRRIAVEKDGNKTQLEKLVDSLNSVAVSLNQPGSNSLATELYDTIGNLDRASDDIRRLVDLQSKSNGSVGQLMAQLEQTVKELKNDADAANGVLKKIGVAGESVTRAGNDLDRLVKDAGPIITKIKQVLDAFYSRPTHFLLTTRKPEEQNRTPARQ